MTTEISNLKTNSGLTDEAFNQIVQFYRVWDINDASIVDDICNPDWQDIPLAPGQPQGPEGLKSLIRFFNETFPDIEIKILDIFGSADRVAVRGEMVFTHNQAFLGIPPSDRKVHIPIFEIHHLRDGKITHTWHLEDWFALLLQSGVWKQG